MDIWISRNGRTTICASCHETIAIDEPVVRGRLWKRSKEENTTSRWSKTFTWHTKNQDGICCWLAEGLLALEKTPKVETRGRKATGLPADIQTYRVKLLKRRGSIMQRLKKQTNVPIEVRDLDKIILLGQQLDKVKLEIEKYGGVPDNW